LLFAGLAGLSVAVVLQLVDKQPAIEKALGVALLCFSVALPVLVSSFLLEVAGASKDKTTWRRLFDLAGVVLALAGLALLFFHLHPLAGGLFLGSVLVSLVVVVRTLP
jgi:hypothetical protein